MKPYEYLTLLACLIAGVVFGELYRHQSEPKPVATYTEYQIGTGLGYYYSANFVPCGDHVEFDIYKVVAGGQEKAFKAHASLPWASILSVTATQVPK